MAKFFMVSSVVLEEAINISQSVEDFNIEDKNDYRKVSDLFINKKINITSGKLYKVETVLKIINEIIGKKYSIKFLPQKNVAGHYTITPYRLEENLTTNYIKNNYYFEAYHSYVISMNFSCYGV